MTIKNDAFVISRVPLTLREKFLKAVAKKKTTVSSAIRSMIENYVKFNG